MAKSLLFSGTLPFTEIPGCALGRQEAEVAIRKDGKIYRLKMRDKLTVEDPYLVAVRATIYAIRNQVPYPATPTSRDIRDYLLKNNIII